MTDHMTFPVHPCTLKIRALQSLFPTWQPLQYSLVFAFATGVSVGGVAVVFLTNTQTCRR